MKKISIIASALLLLTACGGGNPLQKLEQEEQSIQAQIAELETKHAEIKKQIAELKGDSGSADKGAYVQVSLATIEQGSFTHHIDIQGVVSTDKNVTLSAENGGKVIKVYVKEGQRVAKGQRLVDLDGSVLEANMAELNTRLALAKDVYNKQKALWEKKIGTEIQYLQAKNNYEALQNQQAALATQLEKFQLKAPFAGTVDDVMVNLGEMTAPGLPVVRVVDLVDLEVTADVSEKYVSSFKAGDAVSVYFPSLKDTVKAKITAVGQVINPNNRTFSLHVNIPGNNTHLKPNLLAIITAADYTADKVISIPSNLIQTLGTEKFVFIAEKEGNDMKARQVSIKTGQSAGGRTVITEGLNAGDQLITNGYLEVEAGDIVKTL